MHAFIFPLIWDLDIEFPRGKSVSFLPIIISFLFSSKPANWKSITILALFKFALNVLNRINDSYDHEIVLFATP